MLAGHLPIERLFFCNASSRHAVPWPPSAGAECVLGVGVSSETAVGVPAAYGLDVIVSELRTTHSTKKERSGPADGEANCAGSRAASKYGAESPTLRSGVWHPCGNPGRQPNDWNFSPTVGLARRWVQEFPKIRSTIQALLCC